MGNSGDLGVRIGVDIQTELNKAEIQLKDFIAKYDGKTIDLKIGGLDTIDAKIQALNKSFGNLGTSGSNSGLKQVDSSLSSISKKYDLLADSENQLVIQTEKYNKGLGQTETLIKTIDTETSELIDTTKTVTTNYEQQRQAIQKNTAEIEKQNQAMNNADWSNLKTQLQSQQNEVKANNLEWKNLESELVKVNNFDWGSKSGELQEQKIELASNNTEWKQLETQMQSINNIEWNNLKTQLSEQQAEVVANNAEWKQLEVELIKINNLDWNNLKNQLQQEKSEVVANNAEWKKLEAELVKLNNFDFNIGKGALKDSESLTKVQNQAQNLQNTMAKMGSNSDNLDIFKKNPALATQFTTLNKNLDDYTTKLKSGAISQEEFNSQNFGQQVKNIGSELQVAGNKMDTFTQGILTNMKSVAQWMVLCGGMATVFSSLKNGITVVEDLNKSWVNLQIAMGGTEQDTNDLIQSYSKLGASIGATTTEVASSGDTFLRQGKSVSDANTLIQDSLILSKVGMIDSASATTYLTSAMKGYGVETSQVLGIVDKLSSVDMKSAVDAGGLAEAMSRTANMANLAGVSMDKLIGYLATVGEVTQKDMSEVGTSFNFGTVAA